MLWASVAIGVVVSSRSGSGCCCCVVVGLALSLLEVISGVTSDGRGQHVVENTCHRCHLRQRQRQNIVVFQSRATLRLSTLHCLCFLATETPMCCLLPAATTLRDRMLSSFDETMFLHQMVAEARGGDPFCRGDHLFASSTLGLSARLVSIELLPHRD